MRIAVAYNLRTSTSEDQAELLWQEDIDRICHTLKDLGHCVIPVEVSGPPNEIVERLLASEPDLVFNIAEGLVGSSREAFYPSLYEQLGIPFTGGNASLLHLNLDKHLAKTVVANHGIRVPKGVLLTQDNRQLPKNLAYPLFIKPNAEGSSIGISQKSVAETPQQCREVLGKLLEAHPEGVVIEEFIRGRELSVPLLEAHRDQLLEIVEHEFDLTASGARYNIYDYAAKLGERAQYVSVVCPPSLEHAEREAVLSMARQVYTLMHCPDFGRVDIRLREDGVPFFIELNPLPCLHPDASLMVAAQACDLSYREVIRLIIGSAARRYRLPLRSPQKPKPEEEAAPRPTARELGITVGRFPVGTCNAITDVKGVQIGHLSRIKDNVPVPGVGEKGSIRTGVTAILTGGEKDYRKHTVAGGFVLNGVGEIAGLTQVMEWGWIETPIVLTNTMSVGAAHQGVIDYMLERNPDLRQHPEVIIPVVGETDDSFLNDVRIGRIVPGDVGRAIRAARGGAVTQGSVGAGTGMTTLDFAGGIGTSSRVLPDEDGGYTIGVLVLSNFGKLRNLTIEGAVVGRELDRHFSYQGRRGESYGSVIVVVATDAPLLSSQLNRLSKRAALGLGRVGSHARSSSGEIVIAFSTSNQTLREEYGRRKHLQMKFISDRRVNPLYEAVIEATEEAVLNAMFCSNGMTGRHGHYSPGIPHDLVLEILGVKDGHV